ncbi:MAG: cytochrome c [Myxococcota bacterium]|nr:cytochrome c [Myxococcota bacterium]
MTLLARTSASYGAWREVALVLVALASLSSCGDPDVPTATVTTRPAGLTEEQWGEHLFVSHGCLACHRLDAERLVGPGLGALTGTRELLTGGAVTVDEAYIRRALVEPNVEIVRGYSPSMPSYDYLSESDLSALELYLRALQPPR